MNRLSLPTLIEFEPKAMKQMFASGQPMLVLFTNDKDAAYNAVFKEAAEALNG